MDVKSQAIKTQAVPKKDPKAYKKSNKLGSFEPLKLQKGRKEKKESKGRGVIYIGRIPHGFYEDQMTDYFNQFGKVISVFLSRSKKTGRSKGYGFVEFEDEEVAQIAAETMNNYLMYNKIIQCRYIPPGERKNFKIIKKTNLTTCPRVLNRIQDSRRKRKSFSRLNHHAYLKKTQQKITEFKRFFEERGIDFNFKINTDSVENSDHSDIQNEIDEPKLSGNAEDEIDDQFGVLEIDPSDAEIQFRIPPQVKKVIKKSLSTSVTSLNDSSQTLNEPKPKKFKKSKPKEGQQLTQQKKCVKKVTRNLKEKNNVEEKSFDMVSRTEKNKVLTKRSRSVLNEKKARMKKAVDKAKKLKKEKNKSKTKSQKISQPKKLSSGVLTGK